jgi:hypothetical protein
LAAFELNRVAKNVMKISVAEYETMGYVEKVYEK